MPEDLGRRSPGADKRVQGPLPAHLPSVSDRLPQATQAPSLADVGCKSRPVTSPQSGSDLGDPATPGVTSAVAPGLGTPTVAADIINPSSSLLTELQMPSLLVRSWALAPRVLGINSFSA